MKTPLQEFYEFMEQNRYYIGDDLHNKYNELLEKEEHRITASDEPFTYYNETINTINWNLKNTTEAIPFAASFAYENERITVQLVNGKDVLKLAHMYANLLSKNGIDYVVFKG